MPKSLYKILVERALDAAICAVEIYNKPRLEYREETFSILMLNAWELLLKARLIQQNGGRTQVIFEHERLLKKDGTKSKRKKLKVNRSKNPKTISLQTAINRVADCTASEINDNFRNNLLLLQEIRDNSVHFYNSSPEFKKRVFEVGTASLQNFVVAIRNWFGIEVTNMNLNLMPISLLTVGNTIDIIVEKSQPQSVRNLLDLIYNLENNKDNSDINQTFVTTLNLNLKVSRKFNTESTPVYISNDDSSALPVNLKEEDIRKSFPWTHNDLVTELRQRYSDFKVNQKFHKLKKGIVENQTFSRTRRLDPNKENGTKMTFYNPGILSEFDKYYTKHDAPTS